MRWYPPSNIRLIEITDYTANHRAKLYYINTSSIKPQNASEVPLILKTSLEIILHGHLWEEIHKSQKT